MWGKAVALCLRSGKEQIWQIETHKGPHKVWQLALHHPIHTCMLQPYEATEMSPRPVCHHTLLAPLSLMSHLLHHVMAIYTAAKHQIIIFTLIISTWLKYNKRWNRLNVIIWVNIQQENILIFIATLSRFLYSPLIPYPKEQFIKFILCLTVPLI